MSDAEADPNQAPMAASVQESALIGLRRRLAQQRQAIDASNTIVARIRRRNDTNLDESIRRNAAARTNPNGQPQPANPSGVPRERTPGTASSSNPTMNGLLTQVPQSEMNGDAVDPGLKGLVPMSPVTPRGGGRPRRAYVDESRLQELRRKPKNLSPAASLHLAALLPPQLPQHAGKVTLVLDIDETLVHASFNTAKPFDTRLTIETETERGYIYVAFRPRLKEFLDFVAPLFEVVIFTASMACYAEQLMNQLDPQRKLGNLRLFREHCTELRQARVKDMALLGRPLDKVAIIDNSHVAYLFQPRNAIPIASWFDDRNDREFERLIPMLAELATSATVYDVLDVWNCTVH